MKIEKTMQILTVVLLSGILYMLFRINNNIPQMKFLTKGELDKINDIKNDDVRQARLDSNLVFLISGHVSASVYNTVDVEVQNKVEVEIDN